jgi:hypothetical protein
MTPINTIFLCSPLLLRPEIALYVAENGRIPNDKMSSTVSACMYCGPISESINLGATIRAAISGAVRLNPILAPIIEKSIFVV